MKGIRRGAMKLIRMSAGKINGKMEERERERC